MITWPDVNRRFGQAAPWLALALIVAGLLTSLPEWLANLDSDALYLVSFFRDLFVEGYPIRYWNLTPAPYFFPDMVLFFPLLGLAPDPGYAYAAYAFLSFFLLIFLAGLVARSLGADRRAALSHALLAGALMVSLAKGGRYEDIMDSLFEPTFHAGVILVGFGLIVVLLAVARRGYSPWSAGLFFLLSFLTILSDKIILAQFIAPLALAGLVLAVMGLTSWRTALISLGLMAAGGLAALGVTELLNLAGIFYVPQPVENPYGLETMYDSFSYVVYKFWRRNELIRFIFIGWLTLTLAALGYGLRQWFKSRRAGARPAEAVGGLLLVGWLGLFSVGGTLAAPVAAKVWMNVTSLRYLQPAWVVPLFFGFGLLAAGRGRYLEWLRLAVFIAALGAAAFRIAPDLPELGRSLRLPYPDEIAWLDEVARKYHLHNGYGDYWYARRLTVLSRTGLRVNQILPDASGLYRCINNSAWYTGLKRRGPVQYPRYDFFVVNNLLADRLRLQFGPPTAQLSSNGLALWVYNRERHVAARQWLRLQASILTGQDRPPWMYRPLNSPPYTPDGTGLYSDETLLLEEGQEAEFPFNPPARGQILEVAADFNDEYNVSFWRGSKLIGQAALLKVWGHGLQARQIKLPPSLSRQPIDRITIQPRRASGGYGDGQYGLGHVRIYSDTLSEPAQSPAGR